MIPDDLKLLLFRGESETLDFKRDQYRFVGATPDDKAALVKDCLAFANAWRTEPGHILIGVDKQPGAPSDIVGIPTTAHFDDAALQQLVNAKTNLPVNMLYEDIEIDGKSVGVITFGVPQARPVYLLKPFAKLDALAVYIRRGSSTEICKPEEIARMGGASSPGKRLNFELGFADGDPLKSMGAEFKVHAIQLTRPEWVDEPEAIQPGYFTGMLLNPFGGRTRSKSEKWEAVQDIVRFAAVHFEIANTGSGTAQDIMVEIVIDGEHPVEFRDEWNAPQREHQSGYLNVPYVPGHCDASVESEGDGWRICLLVRRLHAGQIHRFDPLYIAMREERRVTLALEAHVYAHDLPMPMPQRLVLELDRKELEYRPDMPEFFGL